MTVIAGCGGSSSTTTDATHPRPKAQRPTPNAPREHAAKLLRGWDRVIDRRDGFSFGVPPGWRAHTVASGQLVRSPDRALAVSVAYDSGPDARAVNVRQYASRLARSLQGYRNLHVGPAHRVPRQRYPTATVQARGVFLKTHVRQAILVVAVHRPRRGTFSVLAFRSARTRAFRYAPWLAELVRTLRVTR